MQANPSVSEPESNGQAIASAANRTASGLAREFQDFIADVEDLARATSSLTGEELVRARAKLGKRLAAAKESVEAISGAISDQAQSAVKTTDSYVREHPWQAVGIGAALGLLLGITLARRN